MAASGAPAPARQPRRGPAPIASFDHDVSDESSPETKQSFRLPEIRECPPAGAGVGAGAGGATSPAGEGASLAPGEPRARSHSTPAATALPAPRIDISRASSSSHHDSRDSSPELALFAGAPDDERQRLELGFREDGALDLRSSTEELAFLEPTPAPPPPPPPADRRHSRKDSQSSEVALLAVSGRTSRLSSVGSQCSAVSGVSRVSRLSVVSGVSRSPSPHRMLLETSFCGPKPIETDPEICAAAVVEHILELVKTEGGEAAPAPLDARDRREVRTEVTLEPAPVAAPVPAPAPAPAPTAAAAPPTVIVEDKPQKDTKNRECSEERRARPRVRREPSEPEVYKSRNKSKDIIRIKLKPDEGDEEEESEGEGGARPPASLALTGAARPAAPSLSPRRRSPSPAGGPVSRKSSFCSLFKSRETIASPDSPSEALRRKRSLTEGRSRSKSRDRTATPTSAGKIRGSVLSLFRTPRRSAASPSGVSRDVSPGVAPRPPPSPSARPPPDKLKYYEDAKDGIIHIPLRTPPEEAGTEPAARPASAPQPRSAPDPPPLAAPRPAPVPVPAKPTQRTVLPDGSIIIPLHSPTERNTHAEFPEVVSSPASVTSAAPSAASVTSAAPSAASAAGASKEERASVSSGAARSPSSGAAPSPSSGAGSAASPPAPPPATDEAHRRRKERLVFTTHVGSREQVFSTQFSITKTPSVTSEISGSLPSFADCEETRAPPLRDTHITGPAPAPVPTPAPAPVTPIDPRDSSESEPSSEAATPQAGNDVERRGLVVQESFEEELPYVPTTLPQERSMALPMVPVSERGGVRVSGVQRPRAAPPRAAAPRAVPPPPPAARDAPPADKLRIKLPRRPRPPSAPTPTAVPAPAPAPRDRERSRSGGDSGAKREWIDFEEVPERRKPPKRIQTLPAAEGAGGLVFSYVEPEHCRCECHGHARPNSDDQLPLLHDDPRHSTISTSSAEGPDETTAEPALSPHAHSHTEARQ